MKNTLLAFIILTLSSCYRPTFVMTKVVKIKPNKVICSNGIDSYIIRPTERMYIGQVVQMNTKTHTYLIPKR